MGEDNKDEGSMPHPVRINASITSVSLMHLHETKAYYAASVMTVPRRWLPFHSCLGAGSQRLGRSRRTSDSSQQEEVTAVREATGRGERWWFYTRFCSWNRLKWISFFPHAKNSHWAGVRELRACCPPGISVWLQLEKLESSGSPLAPNQWTEQADVCP